MTKVKVKQADKPAKTVKTKKAYHLKMTFNGLTFEVDTDDLAASIIELRPHFLKTKVVFTVTNAKGQVWEKAFFVHQGKRILRNALALKIMLNKMIFKNGI